MLACVCVCMCVSVVIVKHPVLPPCAVDGQSRNLYCYYYVYLWSCRSPFLLPPPPQMTVEESEYHRQKQFKQVGQPLLLVRPVCCSCVANSLSVCSQKTCSSCKLCSKQPVSVFSKTLVHHVSCQFFQAFL